MKFIKTILNWYRNSENDIDYEEAKQILFDDENAILLDVRSKQEYKEGHLDYAINIPLYDLETNIYNKLTDKNQTIIVYCQTGNRSKKAFNILSKNGYTNIYNIQGGLDNI